jgi:predicted permease
VFSAPPLNVARLPLPLALGQLRLELRDQGLHDETQLSAPCPQFKAIRATSISVRFVLKSALALLTRDWNTLIQASFRSSLYNGLECALPLTWTMLVASAVAGALCVSATGHVLVRRGKLEQRSSLATLQALQYYVTGPSFALLALGRALSLHDVAVLLPLVACNVLACTLGALLGLLLVAICKFELQSGVFVVGMCAFANVSSLPLYLAMSLFPESKAKLFAYESVYTGTQFVLTWTLFYPLASFVVDRALQADRGVELRAAGEVTPLRVDAKELLWRVFNPTTCGTLAGLLVALVAPLKGFFFGTLAFFFVPLLGEGDVDCLTHSN